VTATRRRGQGPHPAAGWGARGGTKPGQAPGQAPEGGPRRQHPGQAREGPRGGGGAGTSPRRPPQGADRTPRRAARAADRGPAKRAAQEGHPDDGARQGRRRRGDRPAYRRSPARRARRAEHGASGRRSGADGGDGEGRTTPAPDAPARTAGERKPPQKRRKSNIFRFGDSERQILHREFDIMLEIWSDFCYHFLIT